MLLAGRSNIFEHIRDCALSQFLLHRRLGFLVMSEQPLLDAPAHWTEWVWALAVQHEDRSRSDEAIYIGERNGRGLWRGSSVQGSLSAGKQTAKNLES